MSTPDFFRSRLDAMIDLHHPVAVVLVQVDGLAEKFPIFMDTFAIEQDNIPDGRRSGIFEAGNGEVKLPLANAVHQLDTGNRGRGAPEPFEAEHHVRSGLDVSMVLLDQIVQVLRGPDLRVLRQQAMAFISRTARCEAA
jgi:hypothetical protein